MASDDESVQTIMLQLIVFAICTVAMPTQGSRHRN